MSGISSGVGLISGIDTRSLISQLLALEARPKAAVQKRILDIQRQSAAYLDVNSALLALKTASAAFDARKVFKASKAVSSDSGVLTATAGTNAAPGTYQFRVHRLVSTQQQLSRGFADRDATGLSAGTFTFEVGGGALATETRLADLNGGNGVARGKIVITDRAGRSDTIDLSTAVTVQDVLDAINASTVVAVDAAVSGDSIRLTDSSGGTGNLAVANAAGYTTADSLGLAGSVAASTLTGASIRTISESTALAALNDGNGVHIRDGAADLIVTDRAGHVVNVNLGLIQHAETVDGQQVTITDQTRAVTVGDVIRIFNAAAQAAGANVTLSLNASRTGLVVTDTTDAPEITGNLIVQSGLEGRTTAQDLGIATDAGGVASSSVAGRRVVAALNSTLAANLNGGFGLTDSSTGLTVTDRAGNSKTILLSAAALAGSVTDVLEEINAKLADTSGGQPRVNVTFGLNAAGNGFAATDTTDPGAVTGGLTISGGTATQLGLVADNDTDGLVQGANLQAKWISRATLVSSLNAGKGIGTGRFRATDAAGNTTTYEITSNIRTVDDLILFINSRPLSTVRAAINANGDGIILTDSSGGAGRLKVVDETGTVARSLNLAGEAASAGGSINGSYERSVAFASGDTLEAVANKINNAGVGVAATIIRDGAGAAPYRLSLTARTAGQIGRTIIDTGGFDLGLQTLSRGDDSIAFFGATDPARAVLLRSSSNTLDNVVQGVNIDLASASTSTVELTVSRDAAAVEDAIKSFVTAFNTALDKLARYDTYDADTNTRGALLGDSTATRVRSELLRTVQGAPLGVSGRYQRLFQVGIRVGSGGKLEFNAERFRAALQEAPQNVEDLFTANTRTTSTRREVSPGVFVTEGTESISALGVVEKLESLADSFTNSADGVLTRRGRALDDQKKSQQKLIESIDLRLEQKRARLERQFSTMEQALAQLQSQQGAIGRIQTAG